MMAQLMGKEVLYEPLKELSEKVGSTFLFPFSFDGIQFALIVLNSSPST